MIGARYVGGDKGSTPVTCVFGALEWAYVVFSKVICGKTVPINIFSLSRRLLQLLVPAV